jgi:hypothetical protein
MDGRRLRRGGLRGGTEAAERDSHPQAGEARDLRLVATISTSTRRHRPRRKIRVTSRLPHLKSKGRMRAWAVQPCPQARLSSSSVTAVAIRRPVPGKSWSTGMVRSGDWADQRALLAALLRSRTGVRVLYLRQSTASRPRGRWTFTTWGCGDPASPLSARLPAKSPAR